MSDIEFRPFPKIPRLKRSIIITEKIDGTNAQVHIANDGRVLAGSRNRWLTVDSDNFGFARWVAEHEAELRDGLGVGTHYGEWWGVGIQRRYDLDHKRFSLFKVGRWKQDNTPACCSVVPMLAAGEHSSELINATLEKLARDGSVAAPGFMRPEGVVIYHSASSSLYKVLLENDDQPKGKAA